MTTHDGDQDLQEQEQGGEVRELSPEEKAAQAAKAGREAEAGEALVDAEQGGLKYKNANEFFNDPDICFIMVEDDPDWVMDAPGMFLHARGEGAEPDERLLQVQAEDEARVAMQKALEKGFKTIIELADLEIPQTQYGFANSKGGERVIKLFGEMVDEWNAKLSPGEKPVELKIIITSTTVSEGENVDKLQQAFGKNVVGATGKSMLFDKVGKLGMTFTE